MNKEYIKYTIKCAGAARTFSLQRVMKLRACAKGILLQALHNVPVQPDHVQQRGGETHQNPVI